MVFMQSTLLIEGKTFGRRQALFPDWSLALPPEVSGQTLPLRDLISRIVLEQVQAFQERRAERRFVQALTERQITEGVGRGKIAMGGREEDEPEAVDPQAAVAT